MSYGCRIKSFKLTEGWTLSLCRDFGKVLKITEDDTFRMVSEDTWERITFLEYVRAIR